MAQRIFVYEYLSGGGLDAGAAAGDDAALLRAGLQMRDALLADLAALPGLQLRYASAAGVAVPALPRGEACAPRAGESALDFVRREAALNDLAWVVAPESGALLEALCKVVGPRHWIGCRVEAIRLCASKRATLARLAAHGVATPLAFEDEATRWVVKPDDGAGSVDTQVHARRRDAEADWSTRAAPTTLEAWVEGLPLSLSLLCREGRAELLSINRQRIEIDPGGRLHDAGVAIQQIAPTDPRTGAMAACAQAIVREIAGLRGFVGIDLVWHAKRGPVVIEVNPRLTCAYVGLSAALGRNLAGEVLALQAPARQRGSHGAA